MENKVKHGRRLHNVTLLIRICKKCNNVCTSMKYRIKERVIFDTGPNFWHYKILPINQQKLDRYGPVP